MSSTPPSRLHRALGLPGAVVVGLSAMLGTGVFAVWAPAWELAGPLLLVALAMAAMIAILNAVSTARLARQYPESGGVYAYGRIRLNRAAGVLAGWAFLLGKAASAAAAALTIGIYLWPGHERWIAWLVIVAATLVDVRGIVRSVRVNAVLVTTLILIIGVTVGWGAGQLPEGAAVDLPTPSFVAVLSATGVMFVAFAGYARITVLGEEVLDPARTIPRAMVVSFAVVIVIYVAVALVVVAWSSRGVDLGPAALEGLVRGSTALEFLIRVGVVIGAGSVLITLIAGMGRTLFAMASRGDAPGGLSVVSPRRVPARAATVMAAGSAVLVLPGRLSWALALSGGSILTYYAVAHAASWTMPGPWLLRRAVPAAGFVLCGTVIGGLLLAFR